MLFSSLVFLYLFLPLTLLGYYGCGKQLRNLFLLGASLVFYAWGGVSFTVLLVGSIGLNYGFGLMLQRNLESRRGIYWLAAGVATNVLILVIFKYANFIIQNLNDLSAYFRLPLIPATNIALPIGISFYTFHALSYLVDIWRRKSVAQRNIFDLALYIAMFSQLIAGPIIRYNDVCDQLRERGQGWVKFSSGVERFLIGLGKKVLLANTFAAVADQMFAPGQQNLGALNAWLGLVCYTLQIYYDFSGYSDMAIGLGRMFGFEFRENFNFPYLAKSLRDFWRRWHISLSSFFRDYLYISLGGNRGKPVRVCGNLLVVFLVTGLWHGAGWTFVLWGLFHGGFIVLERWGWGRVLDRLWAPVATGYTLVVVMLGWVLFRADTLDHALLYGAALIDFDFRPSQFELFWNGVSPELLVALTIALLGAWGVFLRVGRWLATWLERPHPFARGAAFGYHVGSVLFYGGLLVLCSLYLNAGNYNPFIYFRF